MVVVVAAGDPGEVDLAVGATAQRLVDHGRRRRPVEVGVGVAHHAAQPGPGEQLEADHRRHRVAGQPEHRHRVPSAPATVPNASGLAGLMAICIQRMSPMRSSTTFTKSKSPMLTPPLVTSASQARRRPRSAASMAASSSRTRPRSTASKPLSATSEQQGEPVGVADLARARAASRRRPARRRWRAPRPGAGGTTDTSREPDAWPARPRWPGLSTVARLEHRGRRATTSSPAGRTWLPLRHRPRATTTASPSAVPSVRSTITMASAPAGTGAPVMMRTASPGPTGRRRRPTCRRARCRPPAA